MTVHACLSLRGQLAGRCSATRRRPCSGSIRQAAIERRVQSGPPGSPLLLTWSETCSSEHDATAWASASPLRLRVPCLLAGAQECICHTRRGRQRASRIPRGPRSSPWLAVRKAPFWLPFDKTFERLGDHDGPGRSRVTCCFKNTTRIANRKPFQGVPLSPSRPEGESAVPFTNTVQSQVSLVRGRWCCVSRRPCRARVRACRALTLVSAFVSAGSFSLFSKT